MKTKLIFLLLLVVLGIFPLHASFEVEKEKPRGEEDRVSTTEANTTAAAVDAAHHVPVRDGGTTTVPLQDEDEGGGTAASLEQQQSPTRSVTSRNRNNKTRRIRRDQLPGTSVEDRAASLEAIQRGLSDDIRTYAAAIEKVNEAGKRLHEMKQQQEVLLRECEKRENDFIAVDQQFETAKRNVATFEALKDSTRRNGLLYNASLQEREWARVACQARGHLVRDAVLDFTRHGTEYLEANEKVYDAQNEMARLRDQFSRQREPLLSRLNTIASDVERAIEGEGSGITEARGKFNNTFKAAEDSKIAALEAVRTKDDFNEEDAFKEVLGDLFYPPGEKKEEDDEIIGAVQYEMEQVFGEKHYQSGDVNSDFSDEEDEEKVAAKKAAYEEMAEYAEEKLSQLSGLTGAQKIVTQLYSDLREREKEITIQEQQAMASEAPLTQAMFETMHTCASIKPFQEDEILGTVTHLSEYEKLTDSLNKATAKAEVMQRSWEDVSKAVENYREARLRWGMSMVHLITTFKKLANPHEFLSVSVEARDAEFVGRLWVGKDFSIRAPNPERKDALCCLVSKDQLRQYRAPSLKPYEKDGKIAAVAPQNALQGVNILANYEWKKEPGDGDWTGDIHLSIADIVTKQQLATYQQDWVRRYPEASFPEPTKAAVIPASRSHSSDDEDYGFSNMFHTDAGDDPEEILSANITERRKNSSSSASKDERSSSADDGSEK